MSATTTLHVRLMGAFSVSDASGRSLLPATRKARGILAYLLFQKGKPTTRERMVDLFWPDRDTEQGRASLRQALYELRRSLGPGADRLLSGRDSLAFAPHAVCYDLWDADDALNVTTVQELFEDLGAISPVFDEWLEDMRRVIHTARLKRAEDLLADARHGADPTAVAAAAANVVALDRSNEPAARELIRALRQQGHVSTAKGEYEKLRQVLEDDGFEVSQATRAALEEPLEQTSPPRPAPSDAKVPPIVPRLAVTGGTRAGATALDEARAEDLVDELAQRIARVPELEAVSSPGPRAAPDSPTGANYALVVTAREQGGQILFVVRMTNLRTGLLIWTMREALPTDRVDEQIGALADRAVSPIISAIERIEVHAATARPIADSSSYEHYLRAKFTFFGAPVADYMATVQQELEAAIDKNPNFVPAYAHLIQSYNTSGFFSQPGQDPEPGRSRAKQLAERLLVVDASHANSQLAMAWCLMWDRNFDAAERYLEEAMRLGTHEAHRLNSIGTALVYLGRHDEGEAYYDRAQRRMMQELDYQRTDYGELYYLKADYERALPWLDFGERRARFRTLFWRLLVLVQLGRRDQARDDLETLHREISRLWRGPEACRTEDAVRWLFSLAPLRRSADRELVLNGLAKAGVRI